MKRTLATWTARYETVVQEGEEEDIDPGEGYVVDTFEILNTWPHVGRTVKVSWQATFKTVVELDDGDVHQKDWDIEPGPGYVDDFEVLNTERLL